MYMRFRMQIESLMKEVTFRAAPHRAVPRAKVTHGPTGRARWGEGASASEAWSAAEGRWDLEGGRLSWEARTSAGSLPSGLGGVWGAWPQSAHFTDMQTEIPAQGSVGGIGLELSRAIHRRLL